MNAVIKATHDQVRDLRAEKAGDSIRMIDTPFDSRALERASTAGMKVMLRGRFAIVRHRAGMYEVYWRKRTKYYYAGKIERLTEGKWQISGPRIGIARYGYRTLFSAIVDFEREGR